MGDSPLKIVEVSHNKQDTNKQNKEERRARYERFWLLNPEQFDPERNARERQRIDRTCMLLNEYFDSENKLVVDLGCGSGVLPIRLRDAGATVHAVDISYNALKYIRQKDTTNIEIFQDSLPTTNLLNEQYDLVLSTDVIAYLDSKDYRLYFAELARLVKKDGFVICSTPLDIYSEDPLQQFSNKAETEFNIIKWVLSYHYLNLLLTDFFAAPERFVKASNDQILRHDQIEMRKGFSRYWFRWNSAKVPSIFWKFVTFLSTPIANYIRQNEKCLNFLEKVTRYFWSHSGISHAIFIAQRRPLVEPPADYHPQELKHKKQVWE